MIYFVQAGPKGPIKIGVSDYPEQRVRDLSIGIPHALIPLGIMQGEEDDETDLHIKFSPHHFRGEWFQDCDELRDFIRDNCDPFPVKLSKKPQKSVYRSSFWIKIHTKIRNDFVAMVESRGMDVQAAAEEALKDFVAKYSTDQE